MTHLTNSKGALVLIIGDSIVYIFSLILTLTIRYHEFPTQNLVWGHLQSFSLLFLMFFVVSFSAGLYDKQSIFMRGKIPSILLKVQSINVLLGTAFFYLAPVSITPKANLAIYFVVSTILLLLWRLIMFPVVSNSRTQSAILIGDSADIKDIYDEVNGNSRYGLVFKEQVVPQSTVEETVNAISQAIQKTGATAIVIDLRQPTLEATIPFLYSLIFSGVVIINAEKLYETIFDRIPLSMVEDRWVVESASIALGSRRVYDLLKRLMDIGIASVGLVLTSVFYPFVYIAQKIEDRGSLFITQDRIGLNGKRIKILKFRSMTANDGGVYGADGKTQLKITKVGTFIRATRIDEFPQFWNVLKGDISLIGPRPELPSLVTVYEKEIPYYNVRHLIKPGLSGWAQIYHRAHPHHAVAVDDTRDKLSYDLFYVKNRSLNLDISIVFQTVRAILSRQGV
ncbi:MAG TPA: sugar transferase [Candidatus Paceibacterota bacterium]|nr:sugar transferase [Candidatus Paceibacterota bacterium]